MIHFPLYPEIEIADKWVTTLKEAAYTLRQYAIDRDDKVAWDLAHLLRDAETYSSAKSAECHLRAWSELQQLVNKRATSHARSFTEPAQLEETKCSFVRASG